MDKQAIPSNKRIGLLDLAAEIRNHIYFLCLTPADDTNIQLHAISSTASAIPILKMSNTSPFFPAILATCKTIRNEATATLYGSNTFEVSSITVLHPFLRQIGSSRTHLRNIQLSGLKKTLKFVLMLDALRNFKIDLHILMLPYEEIKEWWSLRSTGGRQGFKMVQDFPELFDCVLVGCHFVGKSWACGHDMLSWWISCSRRWSSERVVAEC